MRKQPNDNSNNSNRKDISPLGRAIIDSVANLEASEEFNEQEFEQNSNQQNSNQNNNQSNQNNQNNQRNNQSNNNQRSNQESESNRDNSERRPYDSQRNEYNFTNCPIE